LKTSLNTEKENKFIIVFLVIVTTLLVIFFTSKLWMYDDNPIRQTTLNEKIESLEQTELTLLNWYYNEKENFMEVIIDKKNVGEDSLIPSISFEAREIELDENIPVDVIYETDNIFVVHLKKIPEKYKFIDLMVTETRDEEVVRVEKEEEEGVGLESETVEEIDLIDSNFVVLTGDYREIEIDNGLEIKSGKDYEITSIEHEIQRTKDKVESIIKERIPLENRFIIEEESKIKEAEEELEYLSGDEKLELEQTISGYEQKINSAIENKEELEEEVKGLEDKVLGMEKKLSKMSEEEIKESDKEDVEELKEEKESEDDEVTSDKDKKEDEEVRVKS